MFGYFDASIFENLEKNQQKPSENFNDFFNKKYNEAIKPFIENPKFSMKYFLVMANIRQVIFEQSKKDYITKYNLSSDYFENNKVDLYKMNTDTKKSNN